MRLLLMVGLVLGCGKAVVKVSVDAGVDGGVAGGQAGGTSDGSGGGRAGGASGGGGSGGGAGCSPASCANGCCSSTGTCITPTTTGRCGVGGAACQACGVGTTCRAGRCEPCAGCVDVTTGECTSGASNGACGAAGDYCLACNPGFTCDQGACVRGVGGGTSGVGGGTSGVGGGTSGVGGGTSGGGGGTSGVGGGASGGGGGTSGVGGGASGGGGGASGGGGGTSGGGGGTSGVGGGTSGGYVVLDGGAISLGAIGWHENAFPLRNESPPEVHATCPPFGTTYPAWGTDLYTDDSSMCTAAAHAGLISPTSGGPISFKFAPGRPGYVGSTRNGVYTSSWPHAHPRSVCFPGTCSPPAVVLDAGVITWSDSVATFSLNVNDQADAVCPPGTPVNVVWGTAVYTVDSPVCVAAVHDGRITASTGGAVRVLVVPGQASYVSSMQNGVTSSSWGPFTKSYSFLP